ncbi:lytic murein transglycosylase B [Motiliproteus sp. MSK22-1]|uniref:lytic murein transglycosylase B n=1 Tax=Motiliproteus sp. MSK22-1 TaxID=1897630 RepID=UPI00097846C0|nr:lytic murein transglycosylase B [Motiliproteus sp. MSK22-1]OMH33728.1 lytic murein transglycosylase B [Motiliproteus sp. MSK22-1]
MTFHSLGLKLQLRAIVPALAVLLSLSPAQAFSDTSYSQNPKAKLFVDEMVNEGFDRAYVESLINDAHRQESILKAISRPAERRLDWGKYRKIFLGKKRVTQGVEFWDKQQEALNRASEKYGVSPEIIVAIIGVETRYGRHAGKYRVLDALATLAFDYPPRAKFFSGQLKELLYLIKEENLESSKIKGSYAGAMGYGQFIPSSYRHYAVDFDGDGQRDILNNPVDAIGSVANYFRSHGWKSGEPVTFPAKLTTEVDKSLFNQQLKPKITLADWKKSGVVAKEKNSIPDSSVATAMKMHTGSKTEHWLGLHNFYVITRYNHSRLYAMAVHQLSQEILAAHTKANSTSSKTNTAAVGTSASDSVESTKNTETKAVRKDNTLTKS